MVCIRAPAAGGAKQLLRCPPRCQRDSDLSHLVDLSGSDSDDEFIGGVVVWVELHAVLREEDVGRQPRKALVAIDKRVVAGERVQQRARLGEEVGIRVLPEHTCAGAVNGGLEQADITDFDRAPDGDARNAQRLLDREVACHSPRRRSRSAKRSAPRAAMRSVSSSSWVRRRYSSRAETATCCMLRPSRSARARSAAAWSSVSRSVIAMSRWYQYDTTA